MADLIEPLDKSLEEELDALLPVSESPVVEEVVTASPTPMVSSPLVVVHVGALSPRVLSPGQLSDTDSGSSQSPRRSHLAYRHQSSRSSVSSGRVRLGDEEQSARSSRAASHSPIRERRSVKDRLGSPPAQQGRRIVVASPERPSCNSSRRSTKRSRPQSRSSSRSPSQSRSSRQSRKARPRARSRPSRDSAPESRRSSSRSPTRSRSTRQSREIRPRSQSRTSRGSVHGSQASSAARSPTRSDSRARSTVQYAPGQSWHAPPTASAAVSVTTQVWATPPPALQVKLSAAQSGLPTQGSFTSAWDSGRLRLHRELLWDGPSILFPFETECVLIGRRPSMLDLTSQCFGRGHEQCSAVLLGALSQDCPDEVRRLPVRSLEAARYALALLRRRRFDLIRPVLQCDPSVVLQPLATLSLPLSPDELTDISYPMSLLYQNCILLRSALQSTGVKPIVCLLPSIGIAVPPAQIEGQGLICHPNTLGNGLELTRAQLFFSHCPQVRSSTLVLIGDEQIAVMEQHSPRCDDRAVNFFPGISVDAFVGLFSQLHFLSSVAVVVVSVGLSELSTQPQDLVSRYQALLAKFSEWSFIKFVLVPPLSDRFSYKLHSDLCQSLHRLCQSNKVLFADVLQSFQRGAQFHPLYFTDGLLNLAGVDIVLSYLRERRLLPIPSFDSRYVVDRIRTTS